VRAAARSQSLFGGISISALHSEGIMTLEEAQGRRLCLFIDGTWNKDFDNTNVWRAYLMCAPSDTKGKEQITYYTKGVGTSRLTYITGGAFGLGINEIIISAYEWLVQNYRAKDHIFIFGFSRGAYAARSLAGLIATSGIIPPGSPIGVSELYTRYKSYNARTVYELHDQQAAGSLGDTTVLEKWLLEYSALADIDMVGVYDTVGALVGPYSFLQTGLRLPLKNAYHALAIDEHRRTFKPTLYTQNLRSEGTPTAQHTLRDIGSVEQRWFVGAHANVGGGYPSDLLAQIPLEWLKQKAESHGLEFCIPLNKKDESYLAPITNSFKEMFFGIYYYSTLGIPYYRTIGTDPAIVGDTKTVTVNETIDASVFDRMRQLNDYRPKNVAAWAARRGIDPRLIQGSVRADNPSISVA